jgi:putative ABC transport system permease protein
VPKILNLFRGRRARLERDLERELRYHEERRDVIRLIVVQGLRLVAWGLVAGVAGALAIAPSLEGLLFEISPWDPTTYAAAAVILGAAATLATLLPAVRAATIDPMLALCQE